MKWEEDLKYDIRTFQSSDDYEHCPTVLSMIEVSECNAAAVKERFLKVKDSCKAILEIGVNRNADKSISQIFLKNKLTSTKYVGIDLDDKSYLNSVPNNIHTIRNNSKSYDQNVTTIKSFGVTEFDFIFIDGDHSINGILADWEYINLLAKDGVVGVHDINGHPGPKAFFEAIDTNRWEVEKLCPDDWGMGFLRRK